MRASMHRDAFDGGDGRGGRRAHAAIDEHRHEVRQQSVEREREHDQHAHEDPELASTQDLGQLEPDVA